MKRLINVASQFRAKQPRASLEEQPNWMQRLKRSQLARYSTLSLQLNK